jgi:ribosomal protein S18 acetylase RimI-like enzyme
MTKSEATQIAALLNARNGLTVLYDADIILRSPEQYLFASVGARVAVAVFLKDVQWYQGEVCHLSVDPEFEGRGYARNLWAEVERRAVARGYRILQCTIHEDDDNSEDFFTKAGFNRVSQFHNKVSGKNLAIWQKVLVPAVLRDC